MNLNVPLFLGGLFQVIGWVLGCLFIAAILMAPLPIWLYRVWYRKSLRLRQNRADAQVRAVALLDRPIYAGVHSTHPYRYRPLPSAHHIRLLVLDAKSNDGRLTCSLQEVDTKSSGQYYEAVSYRWEGEARAIDCENNGWISVPGYLFELLAQLQKEGAPRYLWADAVCINQNDSAEKTLQLPLMNEIYAQCDACLTWLGWHERDDALAFQLLQTLSTVGETGRSKSFADTKPPAVRLRPTRGLYSHHRTTKSQWLALSRLLSNPWFVRTWTFQEAILPRKVTFFRGQFSISGQAFYTAISFIASTQLEKCFPERGPEYDSCVKLAKIRQNFKKWRSRTNGELLSILRDARVRSAGHAEDKVLGIAGLCDPEMFRQVGIGCEQSPTIVYSIVAEYILNNTEKPLQLLSAASYTSQRGMPEDEGLQSLPSWIPNWKDPLVMTPQMSDHEAVAKFCAGGFHAPYFRIASTDTTNFPKLLHLQGKLVAPIGSILRRGSEEIGIDYRLKYPHPESLTRRALEAGWSPKRWHELRRFIGTALQYVYLGQPVYDLPLPYPSFNQYFLQRCYQAISQNTDGDKREKLAVFWRLLARGNPKYLESTASEMRPKKVSKVAASFKSLKASIRRAISVDYQELPAQLPERPSVVTDILGEHQASRATPKFHRDLDGWTQERAFCLTSNRLPGWVPTTAEPGDMIYVIQGCDLPFVLRSNPSDSSSFIVVGHCYVDGIMEGEVALNGNIPFHEICLA